jgi:hypothetical protein
MAIIIVWISANTRNWENMKIDGALKNGLLLTIDLNCSILNSKKDLIYKRKESLAKPQSCKVYIFFLLCVFAALRETQKANKCGKARIGNAG